MKISIIIFVSIISSVLSSCSSSKFTTRKYTAGIFKEHRGTIKHNTIYVDTTKRYTSLNDNIIINHRVLPINHVIAEDLTTNSTIKKDSVFVFQRRGKDKSYVKRCAGPHVIVIINPIKKTIKARPINEIPSLVPDKAKSLLYNPVGSRQSAILLTILSLVLWIVPVVGVFMSALALRKIKQAKENNQAFNFRSLNIFQGISMFLSIIITLTFLGFFLYILGALLFFGGALVVPVW